MSPRHRLVWPSAKPWRLGRLSHDDDIPVPTGRTAMIRKPCAKAGCPRLADDGQRWCADCAPVEDRCDARVQRARRAGKPSRGWYSLAAWKRRREVQLMDAPLCAYCLDEGRTTLANVADHVVPHREDAELFWRGALQSLCSSCHSGRKQREEAGAQAEAEAGGWGNPSPPTPGHRRLHEKNVRGVFKGGGCDERLA